MKNSSKCEGYLWRLYFHVENTKWTLACSSPCNTLFFCYNLSQLSWKKVRQACEYNLSPLMMILLYDFDHFGVHVSIFASWNCVLFESRCILSIQNTSFYIQWIQHVSNWNFKLLFTRYSWDLNTLTCQFFSKRDKRTAKELPPQKCFNPYLFIYFGRFVWG